LVALGVIAWRNSDNLKDISFNVFASDEQKAQAIEQQKQDLTEQQYNDKFDKRGAWDKITTIIHGEQGYQELKKGEDAPQPEKVKTGEPRTTTPGSQGYQIRRAGINRKRGEMDG